MKLRLFRAVEVAVGCCLAIFLAMLLGLENSISAGVIVILSLLATKKETLRSAVDRLASFALAVVIAFVAFSVFGYGLIGFGVYLFAFSLLVYTLGLQASLAICTVLISHFWLAGHMQPWLVGNEALLMLIGTAIGVGLNLFLPRDVKAIRDGQRRIEDILRACFLHLSNALAQGKDLDALAADIRTLDASLQAAEAKTQALADNTLRSDVTYYTRYIQMRQSQLGLLKRMQAAPADLPYCPAQAQVLAAFMWQIAQSLHEYNNAVGLLDTLDGIREGFRTDPLPQTREEFEARAILYRLMVDTEYFLLLKRDFTASLPEAQRKTFLDS